MEISSAIRERQFSATEYEEMTDAVERMRAPMDHTIDFSLADGKLYCASSVDDKDAATITREGTMAAKLMAQTDPAWAIQAVRGELETAEIDAARRLAPGETMLVVSLIPDQVISGAASLPGYNLQKMTTMVRFWSSSAVGAVSCRYVGLDGGDRAALATATTTLGCPVAPSDGSEETLAKRFYGLSDDAADRLIAWYDAAMAAQYGGEYSYGQSGNAKHSAIEIAQANSDLLALHMRRLADLRRQAAEPAALEKARFDYAAALDTREQVGFRPPAPANYHDSAAADYAELASAGDAARASGADYSGSCPAGTNAPTSTAETLAQMGMTVRRNVHGECPYCRRQTTFDPCRPQCGECGSTPGHDRSRSLEKQKQKMVKKQQEAKRVMAKKAADNGVNYDDLRAVYRTFGGVEKLISRKTNQVVAVGRQANRIWNEKPGFFS